MVEQTFFVFCSLLNKSFGVVFSSMELCLSKLFLVSLCSVRAFELEQNLLTNEQEAMFFIRQWNRLVCHVNGRVNLSDNWPVSKSLSHFHPSISTWKTFSLTSNLCQLSLNEQKIEWQLHPLTFSARQWKDFCWSLSSVQRKSLCCSSWTCQRECSKFSLTE